MLSSDATVNGFSVNALCFYVGEANTLSTLGNGGEGGSLNGATGLMNSLSLWAKSS